MVVLSCRLKRFYQTTADTEKPKQSRYHYQTTSFMKLLFDPAITTYTISFNFTSTDQQTILQYLQANGYQLCGFKGAQGPNQVTTGLPVWFAEPFSNMFGNVEIDYTPLYEVYVFNEATIGEYTTITMDVVSTPQGLGTALMFNQDGSFSPGTAVAPPGSIVIQNNLPAGSPAVTVGLAAQVGGQFLPFCAFTSTPQGSISMTPLETVCLFAAQTDLQSGSVIAAAAAPGCEFPFNASSINYALAIADSTYQVIGTAGGLTVTAVPSGANLDELLNS